MNSGLLFFSYICLFFISSSTALVQLLNGSHLNDSAPSFIHLSWIFEVVAQICFLYLSSNHTSQLHCTVSNSRSLIEFRSSVGIECKTLLDLSSFYRNICTSLCSILIFICSFLISNIWNPRLNSKTNSNAFSSCKIFLVAFPRTDWLIKRSVLISF